MSFISGLSNIFHGIGNFFDGGDDPQKKQQQDQGYTPPQPVQRSVQPAQQTPQSVVPVNADATNKPALNLFQGQPLVKAAPAPQTPQSVVPANAQAPTPMPLGNAAAEAAALPKAAPAPSILHDIVHNPVSDVISNIVHPAVEFGNAAIHTPVAIAREVQDKPIGDIQQQVFGTTNSGDIAKHIGGDFGNLALTALAPGLENAADAGVTAFGAPELTQNILDGLRLGLAPGAAEDAATELAGNAVPRIIGATSGAVTGSLINSGLGAVNQAEQPGATPGSILKKTPENLLGGAVLGGITPSISEGLQKVGNINSASLDGIPGVNSVNPTQTADAAQQMAETAAQQQPVIPTEAPASGVAPPSDGVAPSGGAAPAVVAPAEAVAPSIAAGADQLPPVASATPVTPAADARVAPNAPDVQARILKSLGADTSKDLSPGQFHEVSTNADLTAAGKATTDTMSDADIVNQYSKPVKFVEPSDVAHGNASLERLATVVRNGAPEEKTAAQNAINNIIDAASEVQSRSGRVLNYGQELLDNLPPEAKIPYYIKHIDSLNADVKGYEPIADDPRQAKAVGAQLMTYLGKDEDLSSQIADQQSILSKGLSTEGRAEVSTADLTQARDTVAQLEQAQRQNAAGMVQYYDSLTRGRTAAQAASDWQRTAMLSSPGGRLHALLSTGANTVDQSAKEALSGVIGALHNAVAPEQNAIRSTGPSLTSIVKGAGTGLKKTINEARGNFEVDNPQKVLKGSVPDVNSSELSKFQGGKFQRVVRAATGLHTNLTEGIKNSELIQDAKTEATKAGLSGEDADKYAIARVAQPSQQMVDRSDQMWKSVNNLNKNPISDALSKIGDIFESKGGVAGSIIKNQIIPFPRFLGGQIWNDLTDRNVVAASIKMISSAAKGDTQEFVDNLAKTGVEAGKTYALGYLLTKAGVLTNKDAEGNNYDGTYLHIGDRYIPATTLGFFAPSIILGNAAYNGFNTNPKGSVVSHMGATLENTVLSAYRGLGASDALGAGNTLQESANNAFGGSTADPSKLAKVGSSIVDQAIPAVTGDINAVLNQTGRNPTHEAPQTSLQKTNPATGRQKVDSVASAKASIESRIPFLSQTLPRKANVASTDELDRVLSSDRETSGQKQAVADQQAATNFSANDSKQGVPDPTAKYKNGDSFDNAVETAVENKQYDQASKGLQQQLDILNKDKEIPQTKKQPIEDQIKQLAVLKNGGFDPSVRNLYSKTSLSEWRNMGDPTSGAYDPKTYQLLYNYDTKLAGSGISGNTTTQSDPKYSAKAPSKISGRSAATAAANLIKSNTLGSVPDLGKISFGDLATPRKITDVAIPTIQQVKAGDLIKKRQISVGSAT